MTAYVGLLPQNFKLNMYVLHGDNIETLKKKKTNKKNWASSKVGCEAYAHQHSINNSDSLVIRFDGYRILTDSNT